MRSRRHIHVPGYQDNELVPYRRPAASELHRARQVCANSTYLINMMVWMGRCQPVQRGNEQHVRCSSLI